MKKDTFYLFLLICSISFFTSCKDDDNKHDNEGDKDWAIEIIGTYKGDLTVTVNGVNLGSSTQFISISREITNLVKLKLKDSVIIIDETPIEVGDISVPGITASDVNSKVSLEESSTSINHPTLGRLDVKVSGMINGDKIIFYIIIYAVKLKQNIDVIFSGVKT